MLFRLHFLLYCIFVSYNQFLFFSCILFYVACAFVICLIKYLLTYLRLETGGTVVSLTFRIPFSAAGNV